MFKFTALRQAVKEIDAPGIPPSWNLPVQYDATLVPGLVAEHDELDARFAAMSGSLARDPAIAEFAVRDCAERLHRLRHTEALQLYPVIAHALSGDPIQRRLFWQSRLVMLGLARRALRRFEDLERAVQTGNGIAAAAGYVVAGMAEYRRRNETTMYPMYERIGRRGVARKPHVA
ncbi:MAG: hypothetical protein DYH18_00975 [Xanthomonadales bacterium PRO7]|nr:hypothetical protein [Xanthomonadales bacterium PRO7]HMM57267.1 hypothetical protein [Rudaea sp.]